MTAVSVIVPFYNDVLSCQSLIEDYCRYFQKRKISFELIIVNDNSLESNSAQLQSIIASRQDIKYMRFRKNMGQFGAIAYGISQADSQVYIISDQDISGFSDSDMDRLIDSTAEYDLQYVYQEEQEKSLIRDIFSKMWHLLIVLNMGKGASLKNPLPFRIVSRKLVQRIIEHDYIITALDIALLKFSDRFSFYKVDWDGPFATGSKSEYSFNMLIKISVYSVTSILQEYLKLIAAFLILVTAGVCITLKSYVLPLVIIGFFGGLIWVATIINREQSYGKQLEQIKNIAI